MTKKLLVVLPLLCVLMVATGGNASAPTAASPTSQSMSAPIDLTEPATNSPDEFGACRWYCGARSYSTQAQCQAVCAFECDDIC